MIHLKHEYYNFVHDKYHLERIVFFKLYKKQIVKYLPKLMFLKDTSKFDMYNEKIYL